MSVGRFLQQAAAGNAGGATYVDDVFSTYLYDGTSGSQTITNNIDLSGEGGMVVLKGRDAATGEAWITTDTERGTGKYLMWHNTDAESTTADVAVQSFTSSGFGLTGSESSTNSSALKYVSYTFRRAPGFFDVVAYTGTGTAGLSINHNLGVTPEMMIVKRRNASQGWAVYHHDANASPATGACQLESNIPFTVSSVYWNDTAPTDTVFTLGSSNITNNNNDTYIAYLFATVSGISKVGGYTGTASDLDIDCGFSSGARFVLVKRTDSTGDWYVWDSERGIVAGNDPYLLLNSTAAEVTSTDYIDPLSSGFTITSSAPAALNASGGNYIFLAIA